MALARSHFVELAGPPASGVPAVPLPFQRPPKRTEASDIAWRIAGQVVAWLGITLLSVIGSGIWRIAYQFPLILDRLEKRIEQVDQDSKLRDQQIQRTLDRLESKHDNDQERRR